MKVKVDVTSKTLGKVDMSGYKVRNVLREPSAELKFVCGGEALCSIVVQPLLSPLGDKAK